jgi:glycosyltransferase involved in cell wall biosynthesis
VNTPKSSLLIVTDWFEPGSRAGGPIRSTANLAKLLATHVDLSVLTGSHDLGADKPYEGVAIGSWNSIENFRVWYATNRQQKDGAFSKCILDLNPSTIYLNSMFSYWGTIVPIFQLRRKKQVRIVLAPRGMLKPSALASKSLKKFLLLRFLKWTGQNKRIHFHATSSDEANDIRTVFGENQSLSIVPNLPRYPVTQLQPRKKEKGEAKLVFIGRVHPIKNLDYVMKTLQGVSCVKCNLDVIGPIEDENYHRLCLQLQNELPSTISVRYLGNKSNAETCDIIADADALILPTKGENFGHAIFEAFALGVPAIISDQTCWRNLPQHNAGWDIPLSQPNQFVDAVDQLVNMDDRKHNLLREGSIHYARAFFNDNDLTTAYMRMFFQASTA